MATGIRVFYYPCSMNWEAFWDARAQAADPNLQVGRLTKVPAEQLNVRIAQHIKQQLNLQPSDRLLDVCCGNGVLTVLLAKHCLQAVGADVSEKLIAQAKKHHQATNLHFVKVNALQLSGLGGQFHKINLYFSFQYFEDYDTGLRVLAEMQSLLAPGGSIFIGDTPDARRWLAYYNSPFKWLRYCYQKWKGTEPMGKFWHPNAFRKMAKDLGLSVEILPEPGDLPYAWYRFDALFTEKLA